MTATLLKVGELARRTLGFTLEEIGDLLDGREDSPTSVLRRHIAHVHGQIRRASALAERLEQLAAQLEASAEGEALGEDSMSKAQQDWADLIAAVKAEQQKGTPPDDPIVLELARRWKGLIAAFTSGNPGIQQGLNRLWQENQGAMAQRSGIDPELGAYIGQAMAKLG